MTNKDKIALDFMIQTFNILADLREVSFPGYDLSDVDELSNKIDEFKEEINKQPESEQLSIL